MKKLRNLLLLFAVATPLLMASGASAYSPFSAACDSDTADSAVCTDGKNTSDPITGSNGLIMKIVNVVAVISGVAAVIIIVVAGFRFITSGGSSDEVAGARRAIIYASVGLIIIVLARTIVAFVLSALN